MINSISKKAQPLNLYFLCLPSITYQIYWFQNYSFLYYYLPLCRHGTTSSHHVVQPYDMIALWYANITSEHVLL